MPNAERRHGLILAAAIAVWAMTFAGLPRQAVSPFESAEIRLWPEFDQPAMLVIHVLTLPSDVELPTTVTVRIPARVGEPHAVAEIDPQGGLLNAAYSRAADAEWAMIAIQTSQRQVQVEYYDALARQGTLRSYNFVWPAGMPVGSLAFEVQQPSGSTEWNLDPPGSAPQPGEFGLSYSRVPVGTVDASASPALTLSYRKATDSLSIDGLTLDPPGTPSESSSAAWLPWILGAAGALLIGTGAVLWLRRTPVGGGVPRRRHRTSGRAPTGGETGSVFCHQCGTLAGTEDVFCRRCGTRLRR